MKRISELSSIKESFACVNFGVIASDEETSAIEKTLFLTFFSEEFGLDEPAIHALFAVAEEEQGKLDAHLAILAKGMEGQGVEKARFMQFLNTCITSDGVDDWEYRFFDKVRDALL